MYKGKVPDIWVAFSTGPETAQSRARVLQMAKAPRAWCPVGRGRCARGAEEGV